VNATFRKIYTEIVEFVNPAALVASNLGRARLSSAQFRHILSERSVSLPGGALDLQPPLGGI